MGLRNTIVPIVAALVLIAILSAGGYMIFKRGPSGGEGAKDVPDPNRSPTANAGYDRLVYSGEEVSLDGTSSVDPDGDELTYIWDLDDATDSDMDGDPADDADRTGALLTHLYPSLEKTITYRVVLNVSDGEKWDTDTVQVTVMVVDDLEMPIVNMSCRYVRSPGLPGVSSQYMISVDSASRIEMLLNYSYVLLSPENEELQSGGLFDLVTAPPNATIHYIDKNPRAQDLSPGDSISAKDATSVPEGCVFEIYFSFFEDPSGAVTLSKSIAP